MSSLNTTFRHWYHPRSGQLIELEMSGPHHAGYVLQNLETFGLKPEDFPEPIDNSNINKYKGLIHYLAMKNGWVRFYIDRRDPWYNSNIEGVLMPALVKSAAFIQSELPRLQRLFVALRKGTGSKEATAYILENPDQIDYFIDKRRPPQEATTINVESMVVPLTIYDLTKMPTPDEEVANIKRLAGIR